MVNAASGYMNSVNSLYDYSYNKLRGVYSEYNNAEVKRQDNRQSYVNDDAVRYVSRLQAGAKDMLDSLYAVSDANVFSRMQSAYDNTADAVRNSANDASADRETAPERAQANPTGEPPGDVLQSAFERVSNGVAERSSGADDTTQAAAKSGAYEGPATDVQATGMRSGGGTATRGVRSEAFSGAVRDMAESFNKLLGTAESRHAHSRLTDDLRQAAEAYAPSLERIGVTINEGGALEVDENRLAGAGRNGALEASFAPGGANSGFTNRVAEIAGNVRGIRPVYGQAAQNAESIQQNREATSAAENYRQSMDNYNYAYGYNAPGTLFNLYA